MNSTRGLYLILLISAVFASCEPTTKITGSWVNKKAVEGKEYKSVFISALTENIDAKKAIENAFAQEANVRKITPFKSYEVFGPGFDTKGTASKDDILQKIRATGAEVIITISVKQTESNTRYVPGTTSYAPVSSYGYYGSYYGYYGYAYQEVYQPGYYTTDKSYFLECNFYDSKSEELLYSAQSQTTNPGNLNTAAKNYAAVIVYQMKKDGLLKNK